MKEKYIQFVTSANIKVVLFKKLKVGDLILWSNWSRKIIKINEYNRTIDVTNPFDENISTLSFKTYYVIKNAKMKDFIPEKEFEISEQEIKEIEEEYEINKIKIP